MIIDLLLAVILFFAILKGYRRGLIVGVFSFVAFIVGLAAAIKLSAVAAGYIGNTINVSAQWLPVISFIVVFLIVVFLIRIGAKFVERTVEFAMLGWVNKIGGILLFGAIYIIIFSILLFYAEQIQLLKPATIQQSVSYTYLQPWGPKLIDGIGTIIPVFKNMFLELESFFGHISEKATTP